MKDVKIFNRLIALPILFVAIFCNPIYQIASYSLCNSYNFNSKISTNVIQIEPQYYYIFLVLIFIARFLIYILIFHFLSKLKPLKNPFKFLIIFINCHLYQFIGIITLWIWLIELEGNIVGFFIGPISILIGLFVSIFTLYRITRIPKKWNQY
jgi:hypothetical protein